MTALCPYSLFILYFICLFFRNGMDKEMSKLKWGGGGFPITVNIFPGNLELRFCSITFVDKLIRGNIIFYQHVVYMGKYLPQKGKVRENNECRKTFPLSGKYFPILTTC